MRFVVLFGDQEGFGYLISLWRYDFIKALRNVLQKLCSKTVELVFLTSRLPRGFPSEPG
jgi:hypothetical protein